MRRVLLFIAINFAILCTLIVLTEIGGQITYYVRNGKFIYQNSEYNYNDYYHKIFKMHPYLIATIRKNVTVKNYVNDKTITTTNKNSRWTGAPEDDSKLIRVAVLGGSTTFGVEMTDSDTWPALLQAKLGNKFSVINYGAPTFASVDAIMQLALIVPEIKPDFVVLYEGWNDIYHYHDPDFTPDYYSHGLYAENALEIPIYKEKTLYEKLYDLSAIVRMTSKIKGKISHSSETHPCITYDTPDPNVDRIYVRNLKTLKILSENIAAYTLFVPQILNYHKYLVEKDSKSCNNLGSSRNGSNHIKNSAMPRLMDRFNSLMQPICSKNDPKCIFIDSVEKVNWKPDDFVDYGHFSKSGDEKFADIISQVILSKVKEGKIYNENR